MKYMTFSVYRCILLNGKNLSTKIIKTNNKSSSSSFKFKLDTLQAIEFKLKNIAQVYKFTKMNVVPHQNKCSSTPR